MTDQPKPPVPSDQPKPLPPPPPKPEEQKRFADRVEAKLKAEIDARKAQVTAGVKEAGAYVDRKVEAIKGSLQSAAKSVNETYEAVDRKIDTDPRLKTAVEVGKALPLGGPLGEVMKGNVEQTKDIVAVIKDAGDLKSADPQVRDAARQRINARVEEVYKDTYAMGAVGLGAYLKDRQHGASPTAAALSAADAAIKVAPFARAEKHLEEANRLYQKGDYKGAMVEGVLGVQSWGQETVKIAGMIEGARGVGGMLEGKAPKMPEVRFTENPPPKAPPETPPPKAPPETRPPKLEAPPPNEPPKAQEPPPEPPKIEDPKPKPAPAEDPKPKPPKAEDPPPAPPEVNDPVPAEPNPAGNVPGERGPDPGAPAADRAPATPAPAPAEAPKPSGPGADGKPAAPAAPRPPDASNGANSGGPSRPTPDDPRATRIRERLAEVDQKINDARQRAVDRRDADPESWSGNRAGATKGIFNALEDKAALKRAEAFPDRTYLVQARVVGVEVNGRITPTEQIAPKGRIFDTVEVNGTKVHPEDHKSGSTHTASIERFETGGRDGRFRPSSEIGRQMNVEQRVRDYANRTGGTVIIEGNDVVTGESQRLRVNPADLGPTRITDYQKFGNN